MDILSQIASRTCPACYVCFNTIQGMHAHLSMSKKCAWYRKGKNRDMSETSSASGGGDLMEIGESAGDVGGVESEVEEDEIDEEIEENLEQYEENMMQWFDDLEQREAEPEGPSTSAHRLDDAADSQITEENTRGGHILRMESNIHSKWKSLFVEREKDADVTMGNSDNGDQDSEGDTSNPFFPFASELDWRVAKWAIEEGPGQSAFDRFLDIPGIKECLGLSFKNSHRIHQIVESIPARASWKTAHISLADDPAQKHLIQYRDPIEVICSLFSNPAHSSSMVYSPKKVYTDSSKSKRVYSELWTGKWWHAVQVRSVLSTWRYPHNTLPS
ncbi:hypothetical protein OE88DRAFT_1638237 [Heliocybe sulcata]|uniref:Uncharacterized protein n=1 Tax=Heliocybe sulcata TaxID=5364 RepID=A0A5C3MNV2_9AGAM|nr:hypothetical protein OE88DRAFT_1638237 [Heliocybe sulcata]